MILLDTNVVIDAQNEGSPFYAWSNQVIAEGISTDGVGINAITLAELCSAARADSEKVQAELHSADISIIDLPARAAAICGRAYRRYRLARSAIPRRQSAKCTVAGFFYRCARRVHGLEARDTRCRAISDLFPWGRTDRAGGDFVTKSLVSDVRASSTRQILGLRFFNGDVDEAVAFMHRHGGYLVAPSGTCFTRLREDEPYRRAMLSADLAIADSGLMVLPWRLLRREKIQRISGLKYLKQLLTTLKREEKARLFWILPNESARQKLLDCFRREGFLITIEDCYVAPRYGSQVEDRDLLALVEQRRPAHIVIAIGSGPQEKLGHYLCGKFVVSAGDPLHWGRAWFHHRRSDCDSRLGGPPFSRLVLAIGCAAAHFHSTACPAL